jgi:phosphotransferase system enzyme I (PtsI)
MRRGIAVSPGVAVGTAYCINEIFVNLGRQSPGTTDVAGELTKYEAAREQSQQELAALEIAVAKEVGRDTADIFAAQAAILRDLAFTNNVRTWIVDEQISAQAALQKLYEQYKSVFGRVQDEYLRQRLDDIRDVIQRINVHLLDPVATALDGLEGPLIVVADELLPSQVVSLGKMEVVGIVTQGGSQTSHAAIVARSRGIPAVSGIRDILRQVQTGDTIIVDGKEGRVLVNPDSETRAAYLKLEREFFDFKDHLAENRDQPAQTADGVALELLANINSVTDAEAATAMGATGVGLFRTEYLYLMHPVVPGEEEQFEEYCSVIRTSPTHRVTIRTLDLGGDKTLPFVGRAHREANPFMGWRSIRLCFEHPDFFTIQLRAILRAADFARRLRGEVRMMFPMITTLEEIHRVQRLVAGVKRQLIREGKRFADVPIGIMVEVPAAAIMIGSMLPQVDFVSIGSNDLVQYLMAADRDNPKVAHLCQPLAPAVLQVLTDVIRKCNEAGRPVTVCGEMAGQPRAFALLLGMGVRSFSMSPAFIPYIKELSKHLSLDEAGRILAHALTLHTTSKITHYLTEQLTRLVPDFGRLGVN